MKYYEKLYILLQYCPTPSRRAKVPNYLPYLSSWFSGSTPYTPPIPLIDASTILEDQRSLENGILPTSLLFRIPRPTWGIRWVDYTEGERATWRGAWPGNRSVTRPTWSGAQTPLSRGALKLNLKRKWRSKPCDIASRWSGLDLHLESRKAG
jgi:hypothetical protein